MISFFKNKSAAWFLGFTAVFAAAAVYVFWGTWSTAVVPVMPDTAWNFRDWSAAVDGFVRNWFVAGKFVPDDLKVFLASPWALAEFQYVFAAFMAALGLAFFLRGKGLSPLAAYGAGILLAFSGYWFSLFSAGHLGWFRWMTYGVFAFGLIDRGKWALLGAVVAWASFYQPDLWLLFTVFTGAYFVYRCIVIRRFPWKGALVAAVVFALVGAPSFYNAFVNDLAGRDRQIAQAAAGSVSAAGPSSARSSDDEAKAREERWIFTTNWSLPPDELAEAFLPRLNGDTSCIMTQALGTKAGTGVRPYTGALGRPVGAPKGNYRQHSLYIGFMTCLLALLAVVRLPFLRRRMSAADHHPSDILFFAISAALFFALSCGRYFEPLYRLVFALPFGDYLRAPVKWYHLAEFCVCVLAGFGIEALEAWLDRLSGRWKRRADDGWKPSAPALIAAVLVLIGVFDLARVNRKYCAPVDMHQAQAKDAEMQMTFLHKSQFKDPQLVKMVEAGFIQSLAYHPGDREVYLVGVLKPRRPRKDHPLPPWKLPTTLGLISLAATVSVCAAELVRGLFRKSVNENTLKAKS